MTVTEPIIKDGQTKMNHHQRLLLKPMELEEELELVLVQVLDKDQELAANPKPCQDPKLVTKLVVLQVQDTQVEITSSVTTTNNKQNPNNNKHNHQPLL